jgi:hypothetical protein
MARPEGSVLRRKLGITAILQRRSIRRRSDRRGQRRESNRIRCGGPTQSGYWRSSIGYSAGIVTIRNPTVLNPPKASRPSPINTHLQLVPFAYQEPPRISFTGFPFSAPLVAMILLNELPSVPRTLSPLLQSADWPRFSTLVAPLWPRSCRCAPARRWHATFEAGFCLVSR